MDSIAAQGAWSKEATQDWTALSCCASKLQKNRKIFGTHILQRNPGILTYYQPPTSCRLADCKVNSIFNAMLT
jgi:hypothetical protein